MLIWDNHTCMPLRPGDEAFLPQLERHRRAGANVVSINVGFGTQGIVEHVRMLAHFRRWLLARPDEYFLVETAADVERAASNGKLGIFFDIEGANAVEDQPSLVQLYYDLGVRWMSLAYNLPNRVGGGCMQPDDGLTTFGRTVIDEMNRVGMIVCCSHTGRRTVMEAIEHSREPTIFSHSNPSALWQHKRNVDDEMILACTRRGGVACVNGVGLFLGLNDTRSETVARNVDYIAKLAGIDHVGIGLDYVFDSKEVDQYVAANPLMFGRDSEVVKQHGADFVNPEQIPEIAECLRTMGYADDDLARIFGLNLLRLARDVWK